MFLSIHQSSTSDNTNIKLNNPVGKNQHFKIEKNALGQVRFISKLGNDLFLGANDEGNNLVLRKGDKGNKILFTLNPAGVVTNTTTPTTSNTVTLKNTASTFVVEVSKIGDDSFSKTLGPNQSITVNCKLGDVFTFSVDEDEFSALPYTVTQLGITYNIIVGERYTSAKGNKLPNTKASRYSFDILKVDPIYIDYDKNQYIKDAKDNIIGRGGMRKEIFEPLENKDLDWYNGDGDYALKNHFEYLNIMESKASTETKMFYSSSSYEESFSANVGADTPKGGGSASFSHTSSESNNETNIYTYSRTTVKAYDIRLRKEQIALTDDFKNAVKALPKTYNETAYKNFINTWGTHYPVLTSYGGVQVAAYKFNAKEMMESESMALGIEGNMKKASAGGGYSSDKSFAEKQENSKGMYFSKGGTGTGDNYAVDKDNSVPIGINLKRLHELLTASIFNDGTTNTKLSPIKENLKRAITNYIGSPTDSGKSLKPRMYKISNVKWKATKGESDFQVYGKVWTSIWRKNSSGKDIELKGKTAFDRSDEGGSRIVAETNHTERLGGSFTYTVYPTNGTLDLSQYYIKLSSQLSDWNSGSINESPGYKKTTINLSDIPVFAKDISYSISFPREETELRVSADVQEINLGFDD